MADQPKLNCPNPDCKAPETDAPWKGTTGTARSHHDGYDCPACGTRIETFPRAAAAAAAAAEPALPGAAAAAEKAEAPAIRRPRGKNAE